MIRWVDPDILIQRLEDLTRRLTARKGVRHVVVGATALDGDWNWASAVGEADPAGRPMETKIPWFLASVTKLYIASVLMRHAETGAIDLDAPVPAYLPDSLSSGLHVHQGVDYTGRLTARHLLGHFSGLPDSLDERPEGELSLVEKVLEEGDRAWSFEEAIAHARDNLDTHFPPSDPAGPRPKIRYSDTNYQLLMVMAEHTSGKPIEQLFSEHLFEPLGLGATWLPGGRPAGVDDEPATTWLGDKPLLDRPLAMRSFGDLYSTLDDVLSFGRALFTGRVFSDPATVQLMQARFNRFGFPFGMAALRAPSWPIEYGLGMMRFEISRLLAGGMRIPPLVGHTGSTGSWLWFCPPLELLIAGTVDQASAATAPFRVVPRALAGLPA